MISKKNIYSLEKTKKFLKEYPLVMIYQHNNLTVKQRIALKIELQSLNNIKTLTVKNSIVNKIQKDKLISNNMKNLLQGPLFLIGCHNLEEVKNIWNKLKTSYSFIFLGSQFNNEVYTHLDIQKSLEINNHIYHEFFNIFVQLLNFQNSINYNNILQNTIIYNNLFSLFENETFIKYYK